MGKYDGRSRDQKRKAKLKKRAERSPARESLAYHGNKFKSEKYVPIVFTTETGIYESYVISDRRLTDDDVEAALEDLILRLRGGALPALVDAGATSGDVDEDQQNLILWNIRNRWQNLAARGELPGRDDLVGILRTILSSLEIWRSKSMHSQGYLRYIEGFLKQAGVRVRKVSPDMFTREEPEEDALLELGREWVLDGDATAEAEFARRIDALLSGGEAERAVGICQQLLGELNTTNSEAFLPLSALALRGQEALNRRALP